MGDKLVIDRDARDRASSLLGQLENRMVSRAVFEERWPKETRDVGVPCVFDYVGCFLPEDEDAMLDAASLPEEGRSLLERSRLFLSGDLEYSWPLPGDAQRLRMRVWIFGLVVVVVAFWCTNAGLLPPWGMVAVVIPLALGMRPFLARRELTHFRSAGDFSVWPFLSAEDLERARSSGD